MPSRTIGYNFDEQPGSIPCWRVCPQGAAKSRLGLQEIDGLLFAKRNLDIECPHSFFACRGSAAERNRLSINEDNLRAFEG